MKNPLRHESPSNGHPTRQHSLPVLRKPTGVTELTDQDMLHVLGGCLTAPLKIPKDIKERQVWLIRKPSGLRSLMAPGANSRQLQEISANL